MTANLGLTTLSSSQINKENTINTIFGQLDGRLSDTTELSMNDTTADYTLSAENQQRTYRILCSEDGGDSPASTRNLIFTTIPGMYVVENESSVDVDIKISTTTYLNLANGAKALIYNTGSSLKTLSVAKTSENVTLGLYHKATPTVSEPFWGFMFTEAMDLPANLTGSQLRADTAPSGGDVSFTLHKNGGASFGTITFADAFNTATATVTATSFAAGDRIEINAPAAVNGIAELFMSLLFTRTVAA
jgi:hypothetical protein